MRGIKQDTLFLLFLLLVVLDGCSSASVLTPKHTPLAPTSTPTQVIVPVPTPPRSEIALLPTNCPLTAVPGTKIFPQGWGGYEQDTTLIGRSPVWGRIPPDLQVQVSPGTTDNPWTGTKIEWEMSQNFDAQVA